MPQRRIPRRRHPRIARSIVYSFKAGDSPETIRHNFASLRLEQVYGGLRSIGRMSRKSTQMYGKGRNSCARPPELYPCLEHARHASTKLPKTTAPLWSRLGWISSSISQSRICASRPHQFFRFRPESLSSLVIHCSGAGLNRLQIVKVVAG